MKKRPQPRKFAFKNKQKRRRLTKCLYLSAVSRDTNGDEENYMNLTCDPLSL